MARSVLADQTLWQPAITSWPAQFSTHSGRCGSEYASSACDSCARSEERIVDSTWDATAGTEVRARRRLPARQQGAV